MGVYHRVKVGLLADDVPCLCLSTSSQCHQSVPGDWRKEGLDRRSFVQFECCRKGTCESHLPGLVDFFIF